MNCCYFLYLASVPLKNTNNEFTKILTSLKNVNAAFHNLVLAAIIQISYKFFTSNSLIANSIFIFKFESTENGLI